MPQSTLRIGTRGSKLALVQANGVARRLGEGGTMCEVVVLKTSGDRIQDRSLADAGGKGLFTKELEEALLAGAIDLAVHSMKDVPTALPTGLCIDAILAREDASEAFVSNKAKRIEDLPHGARFGTSSVRRHAQVKRVRPDLDVVLLRGNVDTRLAKLDAGEMDGMLLALAGLKRLGLEARATAILDVARWLPSLAQGAIGIEIRQDDARTHAAIAPLNHAPTEIALTCERAFQSALDGSCRTPIAGLATIANGILTFRGEVLAPDGGEFLESKFEVALAGDAKARAASAGFEAGLALKPHAARWLNL
jgi:hydroxymethylbilane synthase